MQLFEAPWRPQGFSKMPENQGKLCAQFGIFAINISERACQNIMFLCYETFWSNPTQGAKGLGKMPENVAKFNFSQ